MYKLLSGLLLMLLVGCASQYVQIENGRWVVIAPGSQVVINRSIPVPPGRSRAFLQRGAVILQRNLDAYHPSCSFEVRSLSQSASEIRPGRFLIAGVDIGSEEVVELGATKVAALVLRDSGDSGPLVHRFFRFRLVSGEQPNVISLTCRSSLAIQPESRLPVLNELREALGAVAEIELQDE